MNGEQLLTFIEGTNAYMDAITHIRNGLIDRGWDPHNASAAARELFAIINMQASTGGAQQ